MPTSPLSEVIPHLLAELGQDGGGLTDGELLARFLRGRDEEALAALVRRHAPMVWGVCRRLLDRHDAEDAFQATFLVLVRKAAGVPGQAVANWLYGVARQTAVRLRATAAKRGRREMQVADMPEPTVPELRDADIQSALDEELSRLPDHYRGVIVLCDLEGMTRKEAARQLGIPEGSVASRLARARAMLARRLKRRGVVFSGGSVATVLSAGSASGSALPPLVASTIRAASLLAAGQAAGFSAKVASLTEGVVKAMFLTKLKSVLAVMLVVALACAAGLIYQTQAADQPKAKAEQPAPKKDEEKGEEKQPMTKEEKLKVLIDKVLEAHGGEEKLNKLKFTEKVKQTQDGNVTTIQYSVRPPDGFRVESQQEGDATKRIYLLRNGTEHWTKYPDGKTEKIKLVTGEPPTESVLDRAKFFGPRVVMRLKDADHRLSLADEIKIDGRPAVGVELSKVAPTFKLSLRLYFDKETNLLVRQDKLHEASSITYADYKKFDSIPVARKTTQTANGKVVSEAAVLDFRAVDKLDDKLFEQP